MLPESRKLICLIFINISFSIPLGTTDEVFQEKTELRLGFVGDIMAHNVNYQMEDYALIYKSVAEIIRSDDLTFGNLEFPLDRTIPKSTYPRFNNHPDYALAAVKAGIDVFSLANNHTNDQGLESIFRTLDSVNHIKEQAGRSIYFSGIRETINQDFIPTEIYIKGWHIGYLAVTQFQNTPLPQPYVLEINYMKDQETEPFLQWLKEITAEYDLFILSYHGGIEYAREPSPRKKAFFKRAIQAGVHIIHGHHPHVMQPVETVRNGGLNRIILYSMGNFISGQGWRLDPLHPEHDWNYTGDSAIITLTVEPTENGPNISGVNTVLTTNIRTPNMDVLIEPLAEIAETLLNEPWRTFYRQRFDIMNYFMDGNSHFTRPK